ncbi:hypothetical protein [Hymenobacter arcticus]
MRTLFLSLLVVGAALCAACGGITSQTVTEAGKQFVLGGQQRGAFRLAAHNVGPVPVSVAERLAGGAVQERGRLEPGQRLTLALGAGSAALVRNLGERPAVLDVRLTGDVSFGMGMEYEGLRK